jgi:hypothetical protein
MGDAFGSVDNGGQDGLKTGGNVQGVSMKCVVIGCLYAGALAAVGCADRRGVPTSPSAIAAVSGLASTAPGTDGTVAPSSSASPRRGALHVEKECSQFDLHSFCRITASNLEAIEVGSRIIYLQPAAVGTPSGSNVVLDLPGPGNNKAFGNCALDPQNKFFGQCTFAGGNGKFTHLQARVDVTHTDDFSQWFWEGTYSFNPQD